jgi:hypothetical protein
MNCQAQNQMHDWKVFTEGPAGARVHSVQCAKCGEPYVDQLSRQFDKVRAAMPERGIFEPRYPLCK